MISLPKLRHKPACDEAARVSLHEKSGPSHLGVLGARQPAAYVPLDDDAAGAQLVRAQLLQVGDLAGLEEDLALAELVLGSVGDERVQYALARLAIRASVDEPRAHEHAVALKELLIGPARRIAGRADAHRLEYAARAQLLDGAARLEAERSLGVVGLDAAHVVGRGLIESAHQLVERLAELRADRLLAHRLGLGRRGQCVRATHLVAERLGFVRLLAEQLGQQLNLLKQAQFGH